MQGQMLCTTRARNSRKIKRGRKEIQMAEGDPKNSKKSLIPPPEARKPLYNTFKSRALPALYDGEGRNRFESQKR